MPSEVQSSPCKVAPESAALVLPSFLSPVVPALDLGSLLLGLIIISLLITAGCGPPL
jgi:hypothetical protein